MSAKDLGKKLLGDVYEERLDELLSSLRVLHDPKAIPSLGIPQLDALLAETHSHPRRSDPARSHGHNENEIAHLHHAVASKAKAPPIIELTSPGSNDGKSQLLYYMTAVCVLPKTLGCIDLDGQDAVVVVLDTESRFSVPRIVQILRYYIHSRTLNNKNESNQPIPSTTDIEATILTALTHIHIFRPQSLASLTATLHTLPTYLLTSPSAAHSFQKHVGALILDSASSFFWQEKADLELAALPTEMSRSTSGVNASVGRVAAETARTGYAELATALREASNRFQTPVIYTTWNLSTPSTLPFANNTGTNTSTLSIRPHLPAPWPSLPSLRLVIARRAVRKFPIGILAPETQREKEARERAVARGVFDVFCNGWGREGGTAGGGFEIRMLDEGVVIEET